MIPDGWKEVSLGAITSHQAIGTVLRGGTDGVSLPLLKMGNILWGGVDLREFERIGEAIISAEDCRVTYGDILLNTRNTPLLVGKAAFWHAPFPAAIDNNIMRIRLRAGADPEFVARWMGSNFGRKAISRLVCASTSVGAVYWRDLRKLKLPLPSLSEQRGINEVLATWNCSVDVVENLIANVRAQKRALMQQLLPQGSSAPRRRLFGFSGEWREIRLGTAFSERVERGDDRLPLLSVTQANGVILQGAAGRRDISSEDQSNYKTVCEGDIAYNTMRMWQGASALSRLTGKVSPAYTVITPRKGHDALFYAYLFKQPKMIHVFERHSQGLVSDTWNLKYPHFAKIRICVPEIAEQAAIAAAFKSLDDAALAYEAQLAALRQERVALMQQLLAGERRLKVPESPNVESEVA